MTESASELNGETPPHACSRMWSGQRGLSPSVRDRVQRDEEEEVRGEDRVRERRLGKPGQSFAHNPSHPPPLHCPQKHYSVNHLLETLGGITWEEMPSNQQLGEQCGGQHCQKEENVLSVGGDLGNWSEELHSPSQHEFLETLLYMYLCAGHYEGNTKDVWVGPFPKGKGDRLSTRTICRINKRVYDWVYERCGETNNPTSITGMFLECQWVSWEAQLHVSCHRNCKSLRIVF